MQQFEEQRLAAKRWGKDQAAKAWAEHMRLKGHKVIVVGPSQEKAKQRLRGTKGKLILDDPMPESVSLSPNQ